MHKSRRLKITDLNPHLTCTLCSGYLIDATTIIECLHSFCRCCIVKYLELNKYCPICDVQVHKTKPLLNIRSDQTLQNIVYKLVPGLFQNEMCRRRDFYTQHPDQKPSSAESNGEVTQFSHIYTADENISLSLEYFNSISDDENKQVHPNRRYLRCPAAVSVLHLQKLIRAKYGLSAEHRVDIMYLNDKLNDDFTLMDIAYIYLWKRKGPLHLTYRIFEVVTKCKSQNAQQDSHTVVTGTPEPNGNKTWKEVQLQISENGIMSVTNIEETKLNVIAAADVKTDATKDEPPKLSVVSSESSQVVKENDKKTEPEKPDSEKVVLGKHKLSDKSSSDESSVKILKSVVPMINTKSLKKIQHLSRNHPLKIHSHFNKSSPSSSQTTETEESKLVNNKSKDSTTMETNGPAPEITSPPAKQNVSTAAPTPYSDKHKVLCSSNTPTCTVTTVTQAKSDKPVPLNAQDSSSSQVAPPDKISNMKPTSSMNQEQKSTNPANQTSAMSVCSPTPKLNIPLKKSPTKLNSPVGYKTLRDPPKAWNPQISRQNLGKINVLNVSTPSTSDANKTENKAIMKPAKFFKMRNNMPRYLGNPASGVKPMYQVCDNNKSFVDVNKNESKQQPKPNQLQKRDLTVTQISNDTKKEKCETPKQDIVKIDPKTLRPISEKPQETSSYSGNSEIKLNQSVVPIFSQLRSQKSQSSNKMDRRSPKVNFMDVQSGSKNSVDKAAPKQNVKLPLNSNRHSNMLTTKKEKPSLNFTPPNPFIPNLTSPNLPPNHFLYPSFNSYDPRIINNLSAYHNLPISLSMFYSQPRLNYPGLADQTLALTPNLMSTLNLELNKNLITNKAYDIPSIAQLSPTCDMKRSIMNKKAESPKEGYNGENVPGVGKSTVKKVNDKPPSTVELKPASSEDTAKRTPQKLSETAKPPQEKEEKKDDAGSTSVPKSDSKPEDKKLEVKKNGENKNIVSKDKEKAKDDAPKSDSKECDEKSNKCTKDESTKSEEKKT